ncbi:hypothetical protein CE91St14_03440 [Porphyromonas somerae]|nr:hypothetical protein CE91St14_03440 [Porphyromonas somerae]
MRILLLVGYPSVGNASVDRSTASGKGSIYKIKISEVPEGIMHRLIASQACGTVGKFVNVGKWDAVL